MFLHEVPPSLRSKTPTHDPFRTPRHKGLTGYPKRGAPIVLKII
jgi:hypothetical protein